MASYPQRYQHLVGTDSRLTVKRLFEGEPFVASFDATSQYAQGGSSACGLASLNAVRMVLESDFKGTRNVDLLEHMSSLQFAKDVSSICSVWASDAHLELDDIYTLPLFDKSLVLVHSVYEQATEAKLKRMLQELRHYGQQASAKSSRPIPIGIVITRPPEIFSILNLPITGQPLDDVFVVFDSHSRPSKHPNGSAFLFFPTVDQTADYLSELLHVDSTLIDGEISWQMQLLSHYSGHFFVARKHRVYDTDSSHALYDANMCILELKLTQAEMKATITESHARIQALESENGSMHAQIKRLEKGKAVDRSSRQWTWGDAYSEETPNAAMDGCSSEQASLLLAFRMDSDMDKPTPEWPPRSSSRAAPAPSSSISRIFSEPAASGAPHESGGIWKASESDVSEQASILLAHRMQSSTFQCGICMDDFSMDYVCRIDDRDHKFCRGCLKEHITIQLQEHRFPIFCPLCCADKTLEPHSITRIHAEELGLSHEQAKLWTELELAKFSLMLPCRKCERFAFVDREDHNAMDILYCPFNCGYVWCKACQRQVEHGIKHSCDGTEELKRLMTEKGYKACPGCKTPTEKIHGCNHMTCEAPHCNTHFCYRCGGHIVQSLDRQVIKAALEAHYNVCTLFESPP